ncbi:MAG: phage holin family protein [Proteobacteria bacterium]|nr:MAG: phage holin family protein [Pseudomonadota bacterium]
MLKLYVIQLLVTWALSALALGLMSAIMPGIRLKGVGSAFLATFVLGALNATLLRILWVLTLPLTIVTLGLFLLVLNGAMLKLTAKLVNGFKVEGWLSAIVGSLVLTLTHAGIYFFYRKLAE